ncbi:carbohydrate kinase [Enterobacter roggenkampii]|uniref:carbohydrate kinase n=1 Tax=Enterobacter roggenkampii TaxID=1812935 RepID=UPI002FD81679
MLRIGQVEATATQDGKYTDGSVAGGIAATRLRAAAFNAMQEELAHIVESAGLALDINDMTQVLKAIQKLTLSRANPFADIKSDGAAAISTALTNLGLVDAEGTVGRLLKIQVFYNSGIYNPTPGTKKVIVEMVGGGGGSAGSRAAASGNISVGGAGGAGSYAKGQFTQNFSGVQITVGTKGAGGTSSGPYASDGGTSSFGSLISAAGGAAGQPAGPTNSFPFSTVATVVSAGANGANIIGTPGQGASASIAVNAAVVVESPGGSSQFGAGGFITAFNAKGVNGSGYGAGGGPSKVNGGNAAVAGGDGSQGLVIVWEYA